MNLFSVVSQFKIINHACKCAAKTNPSADEKFQLEENLIHLTDADSIEFLRKNPIPQKCQNCKLIFFEFIEIFVITIDLKVNKCSMCYTGAIQLVIPPQVHLPNTSFNH